ncbi:LacI family DNA-binding transcriptional regulator [Aegicerativicinus sediminis]|uniref:LacI family DNA-binding transcriptional regulator n=1 Tax=Aegicerativicinus sediminis TaxID=2893202 RepID=UPI001E488BCF|nr:LacI family DNA-binding transcriptional regulator [Aegicerativicinus sediminis]
MANVTLKKIADTLGISPATVSKALKDYPDISSKTKEKVKALAKQLHYTPNPFAQSLRNKESKLIGLIIPQVVHHFFSNIINGVIKAATQKGYLVIVLESEESYEREKDQINLLIEKNVDGILLSLSDKTVQYKHINAIIDNGIPVVLYDKISKLINCSKVMINDRKASQQATQHLIDSGCKKIAHIRGPLKPQTTIDRLMGYRKALELNGIAFDDSLVFESLNLSFEDGYQLAQEIVEQHPDVDGIFAFADLVATGALIKLKELGKRIPDDISIIGFSNWFLSKVTSPSLSTVDQPGFQMGETAFELLYENIQDLKNGQSINHQIVEISTRVIARDSTKTIN